MDHRHRNCEPPTGPPSRNEGLTRDRSGIILNLVVKYQSSPLDTTFAALADPTRRAILARLATGEATVGELAAPHDVSPPAISRHLRVLEAAGLLQRRRDGRAHRCRLERAPLREASDWIDYYRRFWDRQLAALAAFLDGAPNQGEDTNGTTGNER